MGDACRLLSGPAALAAQLSLAFVVLAALLLRRAREQPKRDRRVFLFDVSKQFVSSGAAHFSGLAFSLLVTAATAAAGGGGDGGGGSSADERRRKRQPSECGWYLVLFSVDTVVGSALAILMHRGAVTAAARVAASGAKRERARLSPAPPPLHTAPFALQAKPDPALLLPPVARFAAAVARCGDYGSPPSLDLFLPQLVEWTLAVAVARFCCGLSVLVLRGSALSAVAAGVDGFFSGSSPSLELFSVMLGGPLLMNAGQALVQDGVLRAKRARAGAGATATREASAAAAEATNGEGEGEGEGAELLPSPPSSSVSPLSRHP